MKSTSGPGRRALYLALWLSAAAMAAIMAFAACGTRHSGSGGLQAAERIRDGGLQSTDSVIAELDEMECPEGVDSALWVELKAALEAALLSTPESRLSSRDSVLKESRLENRDSFSDVARSASTPPTGEANRVNDLAITDNGDGSYTLTWRYRNLGDYDQDGKVSISDITPIAQHFNETYDPETEPNSIQAVIDGSGNGKVDIADVTAIAQNFGANLHHYTVQGSHLFNGPFVDMAEMMLPEGAPAARVELAHDLGVPPYLHWRVVPYDADGNAGPASNIAVVSEAPPPAVRILSINPLGGVAATEATFTATVTGDPPLSYSWNFGGGGAPNESAEPSPTVTLGAVDTYPASLTVENAQGSATKNFTLTVTEIPGEPPQIISVSPTEGGSGTEATFSAEVTGDGPLEYAWNFGGGASPNQSTQPAPTATLSRGGTLPQPLRTYPATLTVTNPYGTAVFDFDLDVSAWWHEERVAPLGGSARTYAIGPDGNLVGAYMLATDPTTPGKPYLLYYCRWEDAGWEEHLVDSNIRGAKLVLAYDPQGYPGILLGGGLWMEGNKYIHFDGSAWAREDFDDSTIIQTLGLAYYADGTPVAVYSTSAIVGSDLVVATRKSHGWELESLLDEGTAAGSSFALDDSGVLHIAYGWSTNDDLGVKYTNNAGGEWTHEWIVHDSWGSLVLDAQGRPAVCYRIKYSGTFFSARGEAGWQPELVDSLTSYGARPIVDSSGIPILLRHNSQEDDLLLSFRGPGGWVTEPFGPEGATVPNLWDVLLTPQGGAAVLYTYRIGEVSQLALVSYW